MYSGTVLKTGINYRITCIYRTVHLADYGLYDFFKLILGFKAPVELFLTAEAFDEYLPVGIDHDLGYFRVVKELRKNVQATKAVENSRSEIKLVFQT